MRFALSALCLCLLACADPPPPPPEEPPPAPTKQVERSQPGFFEQHPQEGAIGDASPLDTGHYLLTTDLSPAFAKRYAELIERLHGAISLRIGRRTTSDERPAIWIHATAETFLDEAPSRDVGAFYSINQRRLVTRHGVFPRGRTTLNLLASQLVQLHLHQVVGERFPDLPVWLTRGLGKYFAAAVEDEGAVAFSGVPKSYLPTLRDAVPGTLRELFLTPQATFGKRETILAWVLIHSIFEGEAEDKGRAQKGRAWVRTLIREEGDGTDAQLAHYGDVADLEANWRRWRLSLLKSGE